MIYRIINKIGKISPDFISRKLIYFPFRYRYGKPYEEYGKLISEEENWSEAELESYIVKHFDKIFQYAKSFKLYRDKYKKSGILDLVIKNIEDIQKVPILTKDEIRENLSEFSGAHAAFTGGTTGKPLHFYINKDAWAKEWAYFHRIWGEVGYKYTDAKFRLRMENSKDKFITYYYEQNEYVLNTYRMTKKNIDEFFKVLKTRNVKFIHGHPSSINDFLKDIENVISKSQKELIQRQIECCFYQSEYPAPQIVKYLRNDWGLNFVSWYGHAEQCVFAVAKKNTLEYVPFHTYGFVEVDDDKLIGTSYHNFDMPLIRYDTGDIVMPKKEKHRILKSFAIKHGRTFDYIYDKNDLKINLLVYWQFHGFEIFNFCDYVQVYQDKKGSATIIVISKDPNVIKDIPKLKKTNKNGIWQGRFSSN